jgi:hypothetical protein
MVGKLSDLAERAVTSVSLSRRTFLGQIGRGAVASAAAVAAVLYARPALGAGLRLSTGACFYPDGAGGTICQVMSQAQCAVLRGSVWYRNLGCTQRARRLPNPI